MWAIFKLYWYTHIFKIMTKWIQDNNQINNQLLVKITLFFSIYCLERFIFKNMDEVHCSMLAGIRSSVFVKQTAQEALEHVLYWGRMLTFSNK